MNNLTLSKWADYQWEDWVPAEVRTAIENFWDDKWGRSPKDWSESAKSNGAPELGTMVRAKSFDGKPVEGRYVHAWNNVGRVVQGDRSVACVCCEDCEPLDLCTPAQIAEIKARLASDGVRGVEMSEWLRQGEGLFGSDRNQWRFKCAKCGHVQSAASVHSHKPEIMPEQARAWIHQNCEGRYISGHGCDWSLHGLFRIHTLAVILETGRACATFEFDS
jgi:hypothetical protein